MTNSSDERISSLMDGELDKQAGHGAMNSAVDELLSKDEARETWTRYHLISDTLSQHLPTGMDKQFSSRVMAALENEPTVLAPPTTHTTPLTRRLAGLAVAASVAAVAVTGVQFIYQQDEQAPVEQMAKTATPSTPSRMSTNQALAQATARQNIQTVTQPMKRPAMNPAKIAPSYSFQQSAPSTKRFHPNLNKYLVDHNQQTARAAVQGVMPYARIVAQPNVRYIVIPEQK